MRAALVTQRWLLGRIIMFTLRYTLRQWSKNKFQTLILIIGLALFCTFTINLIASAPSLFSERQAWMSDKNDYVTIGLESHNGDFNKIDKRNLEQYQKSPAIKELMMITSLVTMGLQNGNGEVIRDAATIYLPDDFTSKFQSDLPPVFGELTDNGVIISYDYWKAMGQDPISELVIKMTLTGSSYQVIGVMPKGFKLFQGLETDIVMNSRQVASTYGINFGSNKPSEEQIDRIIAQLVETAPIRFGVAELKSGYSASDVISIEEQSEKNGGDESVALMTGANSWSPIAVNGLQFHPEKRKRLVDQWGILLGLTLGFLIIGQFNLLTSNFSRFLQRQQEFQTRKAVGATSKSLFKELTIENAVLGATASLIGVICGWLMLEQVEVQMAIVSDIALNTKVSAILISVLVTLFLSILIGILPFALLNRQEQFSRSRSSGQNRLQSVLNSTNMIAQIGLAFVSIICALSLWLTQEQRLENLPIDTEVVQISYKQAQSASDQIINIDEWKAKLSKLDFEFAFSLESFVNSRANATTASLEASDSPDSTPIQIMSVSGNYFSVLNAVSAAGERNPQDVNKVVINRTASKELGFETPEEALQHQIYVKNSTGHLFVKDEPIVIVGITQDLPHASLNQTSQPMVYNLVRKSGLFIRDLYVITEPRNTDKALTFMQGQTESRNNAFIVINRGSLWQLLKQQDREWFLLSKLVLALTLLICALAATSLYQQVIAFIIQRSRLYAVMQAVGAQVSDVVMAIFRLVVGKLLLGILVGIAITLLMNGWFKQQFHADLLEITHLALGLVGITFLLIMSILPAIWRQLSLPIQRVLSDE